MAPNGSDGARTERLEGRAPLPARLGPAAPEETSGLYVHLPYCVVKCTYCDFYSLVGREAEMEGYVAAIVREIAGFPESSRLRPRLASVYVGGGTPTHLPGELLASVFEAVAAAFPLEPGAEITIEANPESASYAALASARAAGANRLSLGVQSFQPSFLALMGRPHGPDEPARAVEAARRAGFENVSLDLIYGLPGQGPSTWADDLRRATALASEHLSAYLLETDKETPLARRLLAGEIEEPDAATTEALYRLTERELRGAGFSRYEVSNWARPGRECKHNLGYWSDRTYIGFGASSHSYFLGRRRVCRLSSAAYVEAVREGRPTREDLDEGEPEIRLAEAIVTALRLAEGADFDRLGGRYGVDLWARHAADLEDLRARGWATVERPRVRLTVPGILWSMDALAPFVGRQGRAGVPE